MRMFNFADLIDRLAWLCRECRKIKRAKGTSSSERRPFIDARESDTGTVAYPRVKAEPDKVRARDDGRARSISLTRTCSLR